MGSQDGAKEVIMISARLRPEQVQGLTELSKRKRLARSVLLRQAVDLYLAVNITENDSHLTDKDAA